MKKKHIIDSRNHAKSSSMHSLPSNAIDYEVGHLNDHINNIHSFMKLDTKEKK